MSRARFLLLAALLAISLSVASGRASTPPPIVFAANLAPAVTGEIYRLDPTGRREDLSKSTWQDTDPVVSTDGQHVAFLSNRSGRIGVYEVGINGGNLVRVAPSVQGINRLVWQPHGSVLAAESFGSAVPSGKVWLVKPQRKPLLVSRRFGFGTINPFGVERPWSPDGHVLLVWAGAAGMRAVSPQGRTLWTAYADQPIAAWSPHDLLAVPAHHGVAVYDEHGRLRAHFRLAMTSPTFAWSPDGRYLAAYYSTPTGNYQIEIRTAAGKLVLHEQHLPGYQLVWAGNSEVVIGLSSCFGPACGTALGIDIHSGKQSQVSPDWLDPRSADGKLAVVTPANGSGFSGFSLGVAAPGGGPTSLYTQIGGCFGDGDWMPAASSLQFAGRSRSIVYQSWDAYCDDPFSNLYSIGAGGTGLRRVTNVGAEETQPAVSPDGSQIAYVWASGVGTSCKGCSDGIRIASIDGSDVRTLTNPPDCTFDDSPSWSPDGKTILFSESTCDGSAAELYTLPASGGAAHKLGVVGLYPTWGPSRIAYVTVRPHAGLWTVKPDGSDPVRVSTNGKSPAWSTDGRLAYLLGSSGTTAVIGSARVTLPFGVVRSLAWSPDGTHFVVVARQKSAPAFDIYTVKTDGTDPVRRTWNYGALEAGW